MIYIISKLSLSKPTIQITHKLHYKKQTLYLSNVADVMDHGELMITIPSEILSKTIPSLNNNSNGHTSEPEHKKRKLWNGDIEFNLLEPLIIKIAFTAKEPIDGIHFVVPRDSNGNVSPNISLSTSDTNSRSPSVPLNTQNNNNNNNERFGAMDCDEIFDEQKKNEIMYADRPCRMFIIYIIYIVVSARIFIIHRHVFI